MDILCGGIKIKKMEFNERERDLFSRGSKFINEKPLLVKGRITGVMVKAHSSKLEGRGFESQGVLTYLLLPKTPKMLYSCLKGFKLQL